MIKFWRWVAKYSNSKLPIEEQGIELIGNPYEAVIKYVQKVYKPAIIEPDISRDIIMIDQGRADVINLIGRLRDKSRPL